MPAHDLKPGDSPEATWQTRTADTVARLLTQQEPGVLISETAAGEPRPADALRAAAALRQLGWRDRVKLDIPKSRGLVTDGSQEPLDLTRLQTIATGTAPPTTRAAVRARLRILQPRLFRHEPDAVIATRSGLDVLELSGDLRKADLPTHGLCPAADEKQVQVAATLLTVAKQAGLTCDSESEWIKRSTDVAAAADPTTPGGQEQLLAAGRVLSEFGRDVPAPDTCLDLLRQQPTYRELIPAIGYQTCAEIADLAGTTVGLNPRVASDLELLAETGGQVTDALRVDVVSVHYTVLILQLLGFSEDHIDAVRETEPIMGGSTLEKVRLTLATASASDLPTELADPRPVTSSDDSYAAAMAVNAGGACPETWNPQASWRLTKANQGDPFALLRHATIASAQATCSRRPVPAEDRRRILDASEALHRSAWSAARSSRTVDQLWAASESMCLMGVGPDLPDSLVSRLPDYSNLTETEVDLSQMLAAVRLSDIARDGCGPAPWPLVGS